MRKTISIKRKENKTNLPDHVYDASNKGLGATFTASGDVNTGLSITEMEKYMPGIVYISPKDPTFMVKVKEWFMDLSIKVPPIGVSFEVGKDDEGNPYNVMEYVKFQFAQVHPYLLLNNKDDNEKRKKRKFMFVVEDESREKIAKVAAKNQRKKALQEYIKLTGSETTMDHVLRVLGEYPDNMDSDDKELVLENIAKSQPKMFLKAAQDKSLKTKSFLQNCLSAEALRKVGNTYLDGEEKLGDTEEEAVQFLDDKKNSDTMLRLKAKLKQFQNAKA